MKKILMASALVLIFTSIIGCSATPPFGWPQSISEAVPGDPYACHPDTETTLSKLAYYLINPITIQVQSISLLIFNNIITNPAYANIIRITLILYLIIYGIMVASSLVQVKISDLIGRLIKIGVLLTLLTKTSYTFFNKHLFKLFTTGSHDLLAIVTNPYCAADTGQINFFSFFNYVIDNVFSKDFILRLTALLFSFPIGWLAFSVLIRVMIKYLFGVLKAIIAYLFAFTSIGLLIALGPIFIALLLFDKTRDLFNKWIAALIMFALEPVILFAAIFFVTIFINEALRNVLVQCNWSPFLDIHIFVGRPFNPWDLFSLYWYLPSFLSPISPSSYPKFLEYFASLIVLYLSVDLLEQLPKYVETIAKKLVSGGTGVVARASEIVQGGVETTKNFAGIMAGIVGMDEASRARRKNWRASAGEKKE